MPDYKRAVIALEGRLHEMQIKTHYSRSLYDKSIKRAAEAKEDKDRKKRREEQLCQSCFYLRRGMLAGQAFTTVNCRHCDEDMIFPTTSVDELCAGCAKKAKLCKRCGGDIDMRKRKAL